MCYTDSKKGKSNLANFAHGNYYHQIWLSPHGNMIYLDRTGASHHTINFWSEVGRISEPRSIVPRNFRLAIFVGFKELLNCLN